MIRPETLATLQNFLILSFFYRFTAASHNVN